MHRPVRILPVIIFSQFAGTSLWFAGNAVLPELASKWGLPVEVFDTVISAVQFGFILGTLVFALLSISDRFSPRWVFFFCAIAGAYSNAMILVLPETYTSLLVCRGLTGFFLAGLYPVGMKIAARWYRSGLGKALGFLVGALVLGTAFPHLLVGLELSWTWQSVLLSISILAGAGGILLLIAVPDGPYKNQTAPFNPKAITSIFKSAEFRSSAFGYFGHMWELYAFWVFLPVFLLAHAEQTAWQNANIAMWSFLVIAAGALGCVFGGFLSQPYGSARIASYQLAISALCCLISPILFFAPSELFLVFMLIWGITVVGDSPQFSTLNANTAPPHLVGSALTIVNCIGFSITILSIQLVGTLSTALPTQYLFSVLLIGPLFGLVSSKRLIKMK